MKVLSIKQPWAFLIVAGLKDVENRTWTTAHRGEIGIHASKSFDWDALIWLLSQGKHGEFWTVVRHFGLELNDIPEKSKITRHLDEFGALIGVAELIDCIPHDVPVASERAIVSNWAQAGCNWWKLANPKACDPIPMRGLPGLFHANIELEEWK